MICYKCGRTITGTNCSFCNPSPQQQQQQQQYIQQQYQQQQQQQQQQQNNYNHLFGDNNSNNSGVPLKSSFGLNNQEEVKKAPAKPKKKKFGFLSSLDKKVGEGAKFLSTGVNNLVVNSAKTDLQQPDFSNQPLYDEQSVQRFKATFQLPDTEQLIAEFWCKAASGNVQLEGSTYISDNHFGFSAPYNNQRITVLIAFKNVIDIKQAIQINQPNFGESPTFQMIQGSDNTANCLQIYTSDLLVHQFYDCMLVESFQIWFNLVYEQWRKSA